MENTMNSLRTLEKNYEAAKECFHNKLSMDYKELCQGLIQKRNRIDKARAEFKALANAGKATFPTDKVTLNVGGETHTTYLTTLRKEPSSLLAMMFSGRHKLVSEGDGSYFIDRDPTHFRLILNYLRDFRIPPSAIQDASVRHELLQEAKYYKIDSLVQLLQQQ
ncbi:BTB/POZ protein [Fennellomyces sp. T-0311]|nr:BTB/POZ protein [Fennellomyces sp. T-0311]